MKKSARQTLGEARRQEAREGGLSPSRLASLHLDLQPSKLIEQVFANDGSSGAKRRCEGDVGHASEEF